jgi:hypothetical protein
MHKKLNDILAEANEFIFIKGFTRAFFWWENKNIIVFGFIIIVDSSKK